MQQNESSITIIINDLALDLEQTGERCSVCLQLMRHLFEFIRSLDSLSLGTSTLFE